MDCIATIKPKTIALLLTFILTLSITAQAAENTSVPANNTANISHAANLTVIQEEFTVQKIIESLFFIGIILSPLSFIIAVVALWIALKNRRKTFNIK